MDHVEQKYIYFFSSQLEGFKKVGKNYNFRCPVCGDSEKSKKKKRGWLLTSGDRAVFYCHNCGASMSFHNMLKRFNETLYKEYMIELLKGQGGFDRPLSIEPQVLPPKPEVIKTQSEKFLQYCKPLSTLHQKHPAVEYMAQRKVPAKKLNRVYWMDDLDNIHHLDPMGKYKDVDIKNEGRIIFPFWSSEGLIGVSCRSIDPNSSKRYVLYKFDDAKQSIFGMYDPYGKPYISIKETVYVTEGAVDSLFLHNAIAVNGSDLPKVSSKFRENKIDAVFIPDNEPRNKEIVSVYEKIIQNNDKICIFPSTITQKDINEMVLEYGIDYVREIIDDNTFFGLKAKLKLTNWRKC